VPVHLDPANSSAGRPWEPSGDPYGQGRRRRLAPRALDAGLLALRLGAGALLIGLHGWARLLRAYNYVLHGAPWSFVAVVDRLGFPFPGVFAVSSALSESLGAVLVMLGFGTRGAAVVLAINFAVATVSEAAKGDSYELPALYFLIALVLALTGAGRWSLDRR
jgi:putative oxidoreductase